MELRLEIKLASVEELSTIAKALAGLQVGEAKPMPTATEVREVYAKRAIVNTQEQFEQAEGTETEEEMIEVESPYTAHPSETPADPTPAAPKPRARGASAADAKAAKKAQEEAERAERVAKLKAKMEADKLLADQALVNRNTVTDPGPTQQVEPVELIAEEIKQLGDKLMAFNGVDLQTKQKLTGEVMAKVGVPQGIRPTQLQQPMLGQFRDAYRAMVNSVVNPVMGGLV